MAHAVELQRWSRGYLSTCGETATSRSPEPKGGTYPPAVGLRKCDRSVGLPDGQPILVFGADVRGERSESVGSVAPLTSASKTKMIKRRGGRSEVR
jgi:hypothetical protein